MPSSVAVCVLLLLPFVFTAVRPHVFTDVGVKKELPPWYSPPPSFANFSGSLSDVGVYMRTYHRDALLAAYAVISVLRNVPAVAEVVVVAPLADLPTVAERFRRALALLGVDLHVSQTDCAPSAARVRLVPVGCGVYALPGGKYWGWASRQQLFFDAIHADLYVTKPIVLYMESDVFIVRRVVPRHLFHKDGRPFLEYVTLAFLCRHLLSEMADLSAAAQVCQKHETTARDAGTLFGVFNLYDMERRIPMTLARAMFPSLRRRVHMVHSCVPCVMDYFTRHDQGCTKDWHYVPFLWLPGYTKESLRALRLPEQSKVCLIGLSKPHTLGTFVMHFSRKLHHVRNLEVEGPADYIALQLFSHNLFDGENELKSHVADFLQRAFVRPQKGYTDLDPKVVRATPSLVGLHPEEVA
eukprot:EG_transcript_12114